MWEKKLFKWKCKDLAIYYFMCAHKYENIFVYAHTQNDVRAQKQRPFGHTKS